MIHRINVFLLCLITALCPVYVFAGAAEKWEIVENVYDTSSNSVKVTAKKISQDAANSGVYKVSVPVVKETLGATVKRMLWIGAATAAVTSLIEGVGWVIDVGSQVIKKPAEPTNKTAPYIYQVGSASIAYSIANACKNYMTYMQTQSNNFGWGRTYQSYTLSVGSGNVPFYCALTFKYSNGTVYTDNPIEGSKRVNPDYNPSEPITYTPISDADVGNLFLGTSSESNAPKSPVSSVITDAYNPNNPASDAPAPKETNDALENANPQPEEDTDPFADIRSRPNVDTDGDGVNDAYDPEQPSDGYEMTFPNACEWFPAACDFFSVQKQDNKEIKQNQKEQLEQDKTFFEKVSDWFDWSKEEPNLENEELEIDDQQVINYVEENHVVFGKTCPFTPQAVSMPLGSIGSMDFETDLSFICDFGYTANPYVLGIGHLGALIFLLIGIRNGNA